MDTGRGFFSALFDFSFAELVATRLVKGLYVLAVGAAGLVGVGIVLYGMSRSLWLGVLSFLVGAFVLSLGVAVVRLWLEAAVVLMRIADQTEEIAEQVAGIAVNTGEGSQSKLRDHVGGSIR